MKFKKVCNFIIIPSIIFGITSMPFYFPSSSVRNEVSLESTQNTTNVPKLTEQPTTIEDWNNTKIDQLITLPKFDSRVFNIVTRIKDQYNEGLCWAYAMSATAETAVMRQGFEKPGTDVWFGPHELDYVTWKRTPEFDPLGLNNQDHWGGQSGAGALPVYAANAMQMWTAPSDVYKHSDYKEYHRADYLLESVEVVETGGEGYREDKQEKLKRMVAKYGAICIDFKVPWDAPIYNNTNMNNIRDPKGDHAVTIVGWNDKIPKENYKPTAERDGGWIVKNSWGSGSGDDGYIYISYDSKIGAALGLTFAKPDKYQNNYYYDADSTDAGEPMEVVQDAAAVFPVKRASYNRKEKLKAINIGIQGTNVDIKADIYKNVKVDFDNPKDKANNPIGDKPIATVTGHVDYPGYITIPLENPIDLEFGQNFSIVVHLSSKTDKNATMYYSADTSINNATYYKTKTGQWENPLNTVVGSAARIKAFTTEEPIQGATPDGNIIYADVTLDKNMVRYGDPKPTVQSVTLGGKTLDKSDYTVSYGDVVNIQPQEWTDDAVIGYSTVIIEGHGQYKGVYKAKYDIMFGLRPSLEGLGEYDYYNNAIFRVDNSITKYKQIPIPKGFVFSQPDATIPTDGVKLQYVADDRDNYRKWNFPVEVVRTSTPTTKKNLSDAVITIQDENSIFYTGNNITPSITVTLGGVKLNENTDYLLSTSNSKNVGQASLTIKAVDSSNYMGSQTKTFNIKKAVNTISDVTIDSDGNPSAKAKFDGPITYKYYRNQACTELESTNTKPTKTGTYWVKAVSEGNENYSSSESTTPAEIQISAPAAKVDISTISDNFVINDKNLVYDGSKKYPTISATYKGNSLSENKDYSVTYDNNTNASDNGARAIIKGINKFEGTITKTFSIRKAQEVILSITDRNKIAIRTKFNSPYKVRYYENDSYTNEIGAPNQTGYYYVRVTTDETSNCLSAQKQERVYLDFENASASDNNDQNGSSSLSKFIIIAGCVAGGILLLAIALFILRKRKSKNDYY